jgi:ribulose-5-phosphate 4-epimerase/fuculose-1-phosphate aldolase
MRKFYAVNHFPFKSTAYAVLAAIAHIFIHRKCAKVQGCSHSLSPSSAVWTVVPPAVTGQGGAASFFCRKEKPLNINGLIHGGGPC